MTPDTLLLLAVSSLRRLFALRFDERDGIYAREQIRGWLRIAKQAKREGGML